MILSSDSKYLSIISRRQSHARFTTRVSEHKSGEEVLA
jgi:hypothetical protein